MIISEKTIRQIIRREIKNANLKESGEDAIRKIVRQAIHEQYGTGGGDWYSTAGESPYGSKVSPAPTKPEPKAAAPAPAKPKKKSYAWAQGADFPYKYGQKDKPGGPGHIAKFQAATSAGGGVDGKYGKGTAAAVAKIAGGDGRVLTKDTYDKAVGGSQVAKAAPVAMAGKTKQTVDAKEGTKTWKLRIPRPGKDASSFSRLKKRLWDNTVQHAMIELQGMSAPDRNTSINDVNWIKLNQKKFSNQKNSADFKEAFKFLKSSGFMNSFSPA